MCKKFGTYSLCLAIDTFGGNQIVLIQDYCLAKLK